VTRAVLLACGLALGAALMVGCASPAPTVVVYTSVDQVYSEPVLQRFERESGIRVLAVYDVEATKTTGLVNRLLAEKANPQADVFWSGEFAQTLRLQAEGGLASYLSPNAERIPAQYKDPQGAWTGLAGRARVFLVNTDRVEPGAYPDSIFDLLDARWPGEEVGLAYPLFGTTATHAAALYAALGESQARQFFQDLRDKGVRLVDGNSVVRDMVSRGELAFGLTDTDDACGALQRGAPVAIAFPDQGEGELGTLVIPNTVALVAGGPHPAEGKRLIDFLLSDAAAEDLVAAGWSHVPLRPVEAKPACLGEATVRGIDVELGAVYAWLAPALADLAEIFVR